MEYSNAINELEKILLLEPTHIPSLNLKRKIEELEYQTNDQKKKSMMKIYFGLGMDYYNQKKYRKAIDIFKKILKLEPNHTQSLKMIKKCKQQIK